MSAVAEDRAALIRVAIERWRHGQRQQDVDELAEEVPVALEFNGISHVVMLASPCDLEDFARGFALTEGIVAHRREIFEIDVEEQEAGIVVHLQIAAERFAGLKSRRRNLAGRTGCGLCGAENLQQVFRDQAPLPPGPHFDARLLHGAMTHIGEHQHLQRLTGATHAALWVDAGGRIACLREDVGRHNALDKLVGALAAEGREVRNGAAIVTSRASYEMVQKAAAAGIPLLAAVSAPTALAVRLADSFNLTLVGFLRDGGHVVYAHPERLATSDASDL